MVQVCKLLLHLSARGHGDVFQSQWLEDVLVAIVVQRESGCTLKSKTSEVNVDSILPAFSWLKQNIRDVAGEPIESEGVREVPKLFIEKKYNKTS